MKTMALSAFAGWGLHVIAEGVTEPPPTGGGSSVLVAVLIALLTGASGTFLVQAWRQRQLGSKERDNLIAEASNKAVESMTTVLDTYRRELAEAQDKIGVLEDQIVASNERIATLEGELKNANGDRDRLQSTLTEAIEKRGRMQGEMDRLQHRVSELESRLGELN